ncbi:MAG: hypothetical protein H5U13_13060 [Parvibaculum sp.]|nr:hypothetical protein [Parvibaculum sp.]
MLRRPISRYTKPSVATQLKVLFEDLLRRSPDIHVSGPARRMRSNFIYGLKEMPVAYTPGA